MKLQPLGNKVKYILIEEVGRNNLDMHLLFYLGVAHNDAPPDTIFVVFSSDNDFDNVINHCNNRLGRKCNRIMDQGNLSLNGTQAGELIHENSDEFEKLYDKLKYHMNHINSSNRTSLPTKKGTLINFIASTVRMSGKTFNPELLLEKLMNDNFVEIDNTGKVTYKLDSITPEMQSEYEKIFAKPIYKSPNTLKTLVKVPDKVYSNSKPTNNDSLLEVESIINVEFTKSEFIVSEIIVDDSKSKTQNQKKQNVKQNLKNQPNTQSPISPKLKVTSNLNVGEDKKQVNSQNQYINSKQNQIKQKNIDISAPTSVNNVLTLPDYAI